MKKRLNSTFFMIRYDMSRKIQIVFFLQLEISIR